MCYETFQNYLCYNCGFGRSRAGCGILCRWNRAPLAIICLHHGNLGRTFGKCSRLGYSADFGREAQKVKRMNDFAPFAVMQAGFFTSSASFLGTVPFAVPDSPFTNVPACRPLLQPLLPSSATGGGHRRCPSRGRLAYPLALRCRRGFVCADAAARGAKPRAVRRRRTEGILQKCLGCRSCGSRKRW